MAWSTPRTWVAGEVLTAALMNAELRDNLNAAEPVGSLHAYVRAATTIETLINAFALEGNGVTVLRATYAALNTLLSSLGYPFGAGNGSTTMTLPDVAGRALVAQASGGHADVNALGDSDGLAKASRTPKPNPGFSGSLSGGSLSGNTQPESAHTHGDGTLVANVANTGSGPGSSGALGASGPADVSGSTGAGTAHSHGLSGVSVSGSVSGTVQVPGAFLVAGVWAVKI